MNHWDTLIRVENNFVQLLDQYVEERREDELKINNLRMFVKDVKPRVEEAMRKPEQFVSHPVNGLLMIKRFTSDWLEVESIVGNQSVSGMSGNVSGMKTVGIERKKREWNEVDGE